MSEDRINFITSGIHFIRKPAKMGDRYVFNIPKSFIENDFIDPNETYVIYLAKYEEKERKRKK
nr:MAG: hypothetical protein [uncultured archaeon]